MVAGIETTERIETMPDLLPPLQRRELKRHACCEVIRQASPPSRETGIETFWPMVNMQGTFTLPPTWRRELKRNQPALGLSPGIRSIASLMGGGN